MVLLPQHQKLIDASAISQEVAEARGYRSVKTRADLERLGFSRLQRNVPAMVVPVWDVHGENSTYQTRPDAPRIGKNGKPTKYETRAGTRMMLDVPPPARQWLGDPRLPLFVTEGVRKADAAVSIGLCCVDVLGVWNWRGTNQLGGTVALPDWESIALKGRTVYIVFDSDVIEKSAVYQSLVRLKAFLESRGAQVRVIYLPSGDGGTKVGLDDYLAAGHTQDDLLALATDHIKGPPAAAESQSLGPYAIEAGRICYRKRERDGDVLVLLCNFAATITSEIRRDDGVEVERLLTIDGTLDAGKLLPPVTVRAAEFASMAWVLGHWGARAVLSAGMGAKERLREAIQRLSGEIPERIQYAHTGWRRIDGVPVYLHGGGGIGASGPVVGIEVALSGKLQRVWLPVPPTGEGRRAAVAASLGLLDLATPRVTAPVLGVTYLAPLRELLVPDVPDFVVFQVGDSGEKKSEVAALAMGHYGDFTRLSLPANFRTTANALERLLFELKDALSVVDDYNPVTAPSEAHAMDQVASRLLRSVGNADARSRMRADLTLRPDYPPRGVVLATGERKPGGYSAQARAFWVTVPKGAVDLVLLTAAQRQRHLLPQAMAAYVQWLAQHWDRLATELPVRFRALRQQAAGDGHAREPGQVAHLQLAIEVLLEFAVECGALTREAADQQREAAWSALLAEAGEARADVKMKRLPASSCGCWPMGLLPALPTWITLIPIRRHLAGSWCHRWTSQEGKCSRLATPQGQPPLGGSTVSGSNCCPKPPTNSCRRPRARPGAPSRWNCAPCWCAWRRRA